MDIFVLRSRELKKWIKKFLSDVFKNILITTLLCGCKASAKLQNRFFFYLAYLDF